MLRYFAELVVDLETFPVQFGHAPARLGVLLQRLETFFLCFLGKVEPELDDQRPFVRQHLLETIDLLDALGEGGVTGAAHHALDDGGGVPGTEEDADGTLGRQGTPETPHGRARSFFVGHLAHRMHPDMTRVHPLVQQVDGLALAGAVHPSNQDDDRKFAFLCQIELRVEQFLAQFGDFDVVFSLVDLVSQFSGFEHDVSPSLFIVRRA